jgi:aspartate aminotransferase
MIKLTQTIQDLPHSPTLWANDLVQKKRAANEEVFHMGFGESPFPVPGRLEKALADAAHRKDYLTAAGLKELIEAVKEYYRPLLGDEYIDQTDVLIAPGSKLILYALQMAIEGDLLMPVPSWVSYDPQAHMLHTGVIKVPTTLDDKGYHIDPSALRKAIQDARKAGKNPSKIILNAPNNPTGLIIPANELPAIAKVCEEEQILIISDEIYGLVDFNHTYTSISKHAPKITAVTTGLSKHLSLGGWRIGVGFIPKGVTDLHDALCRITSETWSCVPSPIQKASVEAYKGHKDIEDHMRACTEIHALMNKTISQGLKDLGITCAMAQGAFYNYPNFEPFRAALASNGIRTSQDIHVKLLQGYNLATLPGTGFGAEEEVLTLRLSGCDYDGAKALAAYQNGEKLDRAFVEKYAPRVIRSIEIFGQFLADCAGAQKRNAA